MVLQGKSRPTKLLVEWGSILTTAVSARLAVTGQLALTYLSNLLLPSQRRQGKAPSLRPRRFIPHICRVLGFAVEEHNATLFEETRTGGNSCQLNRLITEHGEETGASGLRRFVEKTCLIYIA